MSVLQLSDLGPSTEPTMSPDGRWAWDGGQWRPLFTTEAPVKKLSAVRLAALTLATSFVGCLGAVYTYEVLILQNLRGHLGIPI